MTEAVMEEMRTLAKQLGAERLEAFKMALLEETEHPDTPIPQVTDVEQEPTCNQNSCPIPEPELKPNLHLENRKSLSASQKERMEIMRRNSAIMADMLEEMKEINQSLNLIAKRMKVRNGNTTEIAE